MDDTLNTKDKVRRHIRLQREALSLKWVAETSNRIAERFLSLDGVRDAETVCLYLAISGEVQMDDVIASCRARGQRILVPAYREERHDYGFKELKADSRLVLGLWGVPEPEEAAWAEIGSSACVAVPGVAFDGLGGRIGHGKGYYDRLLVFANSDPRYSKIGVCFDFQRVNGVPHEPWDVGMDWIVSESHLTRCGLDNK
jgi:5-formyltetrahydrofolate cyclo-ligase